MLTNTTEQPLQIKASTQTPEERAKQLLQTAKQVIATEQQAINNLLDSINDNFIKACELLITTPGRIIVTGIGKSGHIGNKIAASFASLGSPAFFLHAAEAQHGDLGMITPNDIVIALSFSGTSNEIVSLIPSLKHLNVPIIAITGNSNSILAKEATIHLNINIEKEACHLNLAPTSSTTATLVLGDALTIAVTRAKQFTPEDFARSHPGGNLGRRLLLKVSDIMNKNCCTVTANSKLTDVLLTMSRGGMGMVAIVDNQPDYKPDHKPENQILGIFTDGDLRRLFNKLSNDASYNLSSITIKDIMNTNYISIDEDQLAVTAWDVINQKQINGLLVTKPGSKILTGMINIHALSHAKII